MKVKFGLAAIVALVLSACTNAPPPTSRFPDITFQQFQPIRLTVGRIDIVQEYVPPQRSPNVEHVMPVPPGRMAERWARDRLVAGGAFGAGNGGNAGYSARYTIKRASVTETQLPRTQGIRGAFTKEQAQRYDAAVDVELEILNDRGFREGIVSASVERRESVAEDITLAERDEVYFKLTEALGAALNAELERNIRNALPRFIQLQ